MDYFIVDVLHNAPKIPDHDEDIPLLEEMENFNEPVQDPVHEELERLLFDMINAYANACANAPAIPPPGQDMPLYEDFFGDFYNIEPHQLRVEEDAPKQNIPVSDPEMVPPESPAAVNNFSDPEDPDFLDSEDHLDFVEAAAFCALYDDGPEVFEEEDLSQSGFLAKTYQKDPSGLLNMGEENNLESLSDNTKTSSEHEDVFIDKNKEENSGYENKEEEFLDAEMLTSVNGDTSSESLAEHESQLFQGEDILQPSASGENMLSLLLAREKNNPDNELNEELTNESEEEDEFVDAEEAVSSSKPTTVSGTRAEHGPEVYHGEDSELNSATVSLEGRSSDREYDINRKQKPTNESQDNVNIKNKKQKIVDEKSYDY